MAKEIKLNPNGLETFGGAWQKETMIKHSKRQLVEMLAESNNKLEAVKNEDEEFYLNRRMVRFKLMGIKEVIVTTPIVDFKHQITDELQASITKDIETEMPVINIFVGKYKGRRFRLDNRGVMELITRLIK